MNYVIRDVGDRERFAPNEHLTLRKYLPLREYASSAENLIKRYGGNYSKHMLKSVDAIDCVMHGMMVADCKYNPEVGDRDAYRIWMGRKAILEYVRMTRSHRNQVELTDYPGVESNSDDMDNIAILLGHLNRMGEPRRMCIMYRLAGLKIRDIAHIMDMDRHRVIRILRKTRTDLRLSCGQ